MTTQTKRVALHRRAGLGKKWLWLRHKMHLGLWNSIVLARSREPNLQPISEVDPAPSGLPALEIHMLLGHSRIREGLWALLSFGHLIGKPMQVVIHDDGSLTDADRGMLAQKLPQLRVISRAEADAAVSAVFEREGLANCARFRKSFILARKIFDPIIFAERPDYILLDSDVLFFRKPEQMVSGSSSDKNGAASLYSTDNGFRYSIEAKELESLIGRPPLPRINSGILRLNRDTVDFKRVEQYLSHPGFWKPDGIPDYYAEMTILALELTRQYALPLSDDYAIAPNPDDKALIAGHYCGGIRSAYTYYVRALPIVRELLPRTSANKAKASQRAGV